MRQGRHRQTYRILGKGPLTIYYARTETDRKKRSPSTIYISTMTDPRQTDTDKQTAIAGQDQHRQMDRAKTEAQENRRTKVANMRIRQTDRNKRIKRQLQILKLK